MTKYGWRNNKIVAEEITAESVNASTMDFSDASTVSTAAAGTAIYIPVQVSGVTYYVEGKLA